MWMIEDEQLKCKADGLKPVWPGDDKFEVGVLKASLPDDKGDLQAIKISNNATTPKELAINVVDENAEDYAVGTRVTMKAESGDDNDKRNKWIVMKHHIEGKDWFTLKNEACGYFLTCPKKGVSPQHLIVSYEVPGIQMTSFLSHIMLHIYKYGRI